MLKPIAILLFFCSASTGWNEYTNDARTYTLKYPDTWEMKNVGAQGVNAVAFASPKESDDDVFQENVNLMLQDLSSTPMTLEEYTAVTKDQLTLFMGAEVEISVKDASLAGQKAKECAYPIEFDGTKLLVRQYFFIKENIAYVITYTAAPDKYEQYEAIAMETIRSFRFL